MTAFIGRRKVIALLGGAAATLPQAARAQESGKVKRIGFLRVGEPPAAFIGGFRRGLVADDAEFTARRAELAQLGIKHRLPTVSGLKEMVEAGGLMAYGGSFAELYRRAASHVHKILQGMSPADLPVEQATKFELVLNLKTAKALGIEVPPTMLARADEVIE
jgi:hypothetical protein